MDVLWLVTNAAFACLWVDKVGEFGSQEDLLAFAWVLLEPAADEVFIIAVPGSGLVTGTSGVEGRCLHVSRVPVVGAALKDMV